MVASYHNASFLPGAIISPLDLLQLNPATYMAQKCIFRISKPKPFIESELFSLAESNSRNKLCSVRAMQDDKGISILKIPVLKII